MMMKFHLMLFFFILNYCIAFDPGALELTPFPTRTDTTHYAITVCALARVTIDHLKAAYKIDVTNLEFKFNETNGQCGGLIIRDIINILSSSTQHGINPWQYSIAIRTISSANTKTDFKEMFKAESHFDSETFISGSLLVLRRYQAAVDSILKLDNYDQARKIIGEMLHTLQDFYSHSNYVELDYSTPSDVLGQRLFHKDEFASKNMRTCIDCVGQECQTKPNIDENIRRRKILTSGYFKPIGVHIFDSRKPKGKCSHGGKFDASADDDAKGGINKDTLKSTHGHLHYKSAHLAYEATVKIFTRFREEIGSDAFSSFLSLTKHLNTLMISIDTTCGITDYVDVAKQISIDIIERYGKLDYAPHNYILTRFNDQNAALVVITRNPTELKTAIEQLKSCQNSTPTDGAFYYHALIEGLSRCEDASVIYTFTDSPTKDSHLKNQARAILRRKRGVIYSFLGRQVRSRVLATRMVITDPLDFSENNPDLASISGGLTYPITVADRPILSEFVVRRLEWTRLQSIFLGKPSSSRFSFYVDPSITELYLDISSIGSILILTQIVLHQPDNSIYPLMDSASISSTKTLFMWKITSPMVGMWYFGNSSLLHLSNFDIRIQGKANLLCSSTPQRATDSSMDSNGYTQLTTQPIMGSDLLILTTCDNDLSINATIILIDDAGDSIASYSPMMVTNLGVLTKVRVPQRDFRIQTIIALVNGTRAQRMEKQMISPTMLDIELTNQPFIISPGETISMNYSIKSSFGEKTDVCLQITDTMRFLGSDGIKRNLTFSQETTGSETFSLPTTLPENFSTDWIIFTVSMTNSNTLGFSYENDEIASVYLNSAHLCNSSSHILLFFILFLFFL